MQHKVCPDQPTCICDLRGDLQSPSIGASSGITQCMHCGELVHSVPSKGHSQQLLLYLSTISFLSVDALLAKAMAQQDPRCFVCKPEAVLGTGYRAVPPSNIAGQRPHTFLPILFPSVYCTAISHCVSTPAATTCQSFLITVSLVTFPFC